VQAAVVIMVVEVGHLVPSVTDDPAADLGRHLAREYGAEVNLIYVVMRDGRTAANRAQPLDDRVRVSIANLLEGQDFRRSGTRPHWATCRW
jgi:hypothetical protein